jgi:hypothetical protein
MIDGRLERIHPEILLLGNSLDIEGLTDITDVGERIDKNSPLPSPGEVGNGKKIFLPLLERIRQFQNGNFCFTANDSIDPVKIPHDLLMKKTGGISPEKNINGRKGGFHLFDHFHHIVTLMVPVEVDGNDSRGFLFDIFDDRKMMIFNPLHPHVYDLGGNMMTLEKVGQSEKPHGHEIDPDEMIDRPVIIGQFWDMEKNTVKFSHRRNCKMSGWRISTPSQKKSHGA